MKIEPCRSCFCSCTSVREEDCVKGSEAKNKYNTKGKWGWNKNRKKENSKRRGKMRIQRWQLWFALFRLAGSKNCWQITKLETKEKRVHKSAKRVWTTRLIRTRLVVYPRIAHMSTFSQLTNNCYEPTPQNAIYGSFYGEDCWRVSIVEFTCIVW